VVPWHHLAKYKGINYQVVPAKDNYFFDLEALKEMIDSNTKLVSFVHTSNLDGNTNPAKDIIEICHDKGVKVMMDTAQSAPHKELNVVDLDVDFAAASAHKFCGPSGMGLLYGKYAELKELIPTYVGGSTVVSSSYEGYELLPPPSCFEAGLQNYAGAIGAGAAAEYVMDVGRDNISKHENKLNVLLTKELEGLDGLSIVSVRKHPNEGASVLSIWKDGIQRMLLCTWMKNTILQSEVECIVSIHGSIHEALMVLPARAFIFIIMNKT